MKTAHTEITFLLFVFDSLRTIDIKKKILLILILIRNQCSTRKTGTARGVSDILVGYSRRFFAFLCIITSASVSARKEKRRLLLCIFIILQPIKKLNS